MVVVSNNVALGTYGTDGVYDTKSKPAVKSDKVTAEKSKVNSVAEVQINDRLRRQISDLTRISAENQDRLSYVQTANGAIGAMKDILQRINVLSVEAISNIGVGDRKTIQSEILSLKEELRRIQNQTNFKQTPVFDKQTGATSASFEPFELDVEAMGLDEINVLNVESAIKSEELSAQGIRTLDEAGSYYSEVQAELEETFASVDSNATDSADNINSYLSNLLANSQTAIMSQANQTNDSVLSLLAV